MEPNFVLAADGRRLAYSEFGDPRGAPLINCHGGLTSRLDMQRCHDAARQAGIRVISPDRPGIGRSDEKPGRSLLDWPADVAVVTETLDVDRFAVLGWSAGGAFAAACAFALPDRVTAVSLVASVIPGDWAEMSHEINRMDRVFMRLSTSSPHVASLAFRAMGGMARHTPTTFRRLSRVSLDAPSRNVVKKASVAEYSAPIAEGLRNPNGVLDDYRILGSPWGFDLDEINVPVTIWQGDRDGLVPPTWGPRLAERVSGAHARICPGEGHFMSLEQYRMIFAEVAGSF
jgi:pimeloyl-ACP methyl ester carboxylesterase